MIGQEISAAVLGVTGPAYADAWAKWVPNGHRPVAPDENVWVRFRNGTVQKRRAGDTYWAHSGQEDDVIAYLTEAAVAAAGGAPCGEALPATQRQEGGDHYKKCAIQPIEFIFANNIGFAEGNVVKYVTRWKSKGGVDDLKKARHYLDLLIESVEGAPGEAPS